MPLVERLRRWIPTRNDYVTVIETADGDVETYVGERVTPTDGTRLAEESIPDHITHRAHFALSVAAQYDE